MVQKFEYKNMKYKTGRSTDTNLISNKIHCSLDFFSGKSLYTLLFIMRKSLATPQQGNGRRSMLGFGSAASKQRGIPEQKKLNFSANVCIVLIFSPLVTLIFSHFRCWLIRYNYPIMLF